MSEKYYGHCDSPDAPNKEIRISKGLSAQKELDVLLHELLHSADWTKDEAWVDQVATDISRVLWKCGWRKQSQQE